MVIQAGMVKTIGGVWTLCAKTIPNKPISTVPESVEVINPKPTPSYKVKRKAWPKPPNNPAINKTLFGVLNKLPKPMATQNAKLKSFIISRKKSILVKIINSKN